MGCTDGVTCIHSLSLASSLGCLTVSTPSGTVTVIVYDDENLC